MSAFFNIGSLVLGVLSWSFPILAARRYFKGYRMAGFPIYSGACCAVALLFQLFEIRHRVMIEDFTAIMDTIGAVSIVAVVLVVITVVLNVVSFRLYNSEKN